MEQERARIVDVLNRRQIRVINDNNPTRWLVVWLDRGKAKLGWFRVPYWHRYGIDVIATFYDGDFWFQSAAARDVATPLARYTMRLLYNDGTTTNGRPLDLTNVEIRQ